MFLALLVFALGNTSSVGVVHADTYRYDAPPLLLVERTATTAVSDISSLVSLSSTDSAERSPVGSDTSTTRAARNHATNNGGDEHRYTERELKEAEEALRRNQDFRRWFHREYKADVGSGVGGQDNPDLDRELVRDAYEEWLDCGRPGG
jgi:hypothetical protein